VCVYIYIETSAASVDLLIKAWDHMHNLSVYKLKHIAFEFTRPEIVGSSQGRFAMPFRPDFTVSKRQNAETAWPNAVVTIFSISGRVNSNLICFISKKS
jgi:hypothetical protein